MPRRNRHQKDNNRLSRMLILAAVILNYTFCAWTMDYTPHSPTALVGVEDFIGLSVKSRSTWKRDITFGIAAPISLVMASGSLFKNNDS